MTAVGTWILIAGFAVFALIFLAASIGNVLLVVRYKATGRRASLVPMVGGIFGVMAMLLAPWPEFRSWFWIPLVVDIGSLPLLVTATLSWCRRTKQHRR